MAKKTKRDVQWDEYILSMIQTAIANNAAECTTRHHVCGKLHGWCVEITVREPDECPYTHVKKAE